uniref:Uncharacterized protein n=1 Tax=Panagrolaimus sp. ES5 TaxID=591445 RepID=A0AC34GFV4_9BILA
MDKLNVDSCLPKERFKFGKHTFVKVIENPIIPIFRCCPNHVGDISYQNKSENVNTKQESLPSQYNQSYTSTSNEINVFLGANTSQGKCIPKPLPPPQKSLNDSFDEDYMEVDENVSTAGRNSGAAFGFPDVPNVKNSQSSEIQILDDYPSTSSKAASAPYQEPEVVYDSFEDD